VQSSPLENPFVENPNHPQTNAVSLEGSKSQDEDVGLLLATLIALSSARVSQPGIEWMSRGRGSGSPSVQEDISAPTAAADATFGSWQPRAVCPFVVILVMAGAKEPTGEQNHIPAGIQRILPTLHWEISQTKDHWDIIH